MLDTSVVTDWFLETVGRILPTGDLLAPEDVPVGWQDDGTFAEYCVVTPGTATMRAPESLGAPWGSWAFQFQVTSYEVSRSQVQKVALRIRQTLTEHKLRLLEQPEGLTIRDIEATTIGPVAYTKQIEPPGFSQTDTFTLAVEVD